MELIGDKLIIALQTAYLNDLHFLIEYCIVLLTGMLLLRSLGIQCTVFPVQKIMVSFQKKLRKTHFLSLTKLVHTILSLHKSERENYTGLPDFYKNVSLFFSFYVFQCVCICHLHTFCMLEVLTVDVRVEKGVGFFAPGITGRWEFLDVGSPLLPSLKQQVLFPLTPLSSPSYFTFYLCIFKMSFKPGYGGFQLESQYVGRLRAG